MLKKQMHGLGKSAAEGFLGTLKSEETTKSEWNTFECDKGHKFALSIPVPTTREYMVTVYTKVHCPLCDSHELTTSDTF